MTHAHMVTEYMSPTQDFKTTEVKRLWANETPAEFKTRMKEAYGYRGTDTDNGYTSVEHWPGGREVITVTWCDKEGC